MVPSFAPAFSAAGLAFFFACFFRFFGFAFFAFSFAFFRFFFSCGLRGGAGRRRRSGCGREGGLNRRHAGEETEGKEHAEQLHHPMDRPLLAPT
jgi:hypothetical protein